MINQDGERNNSKVMLLLKQTKATEGSKTQEVRANGEIIHCMNNRYEGHGLNG